MLRYTRRQLEYFVAVGETGSIARASERINVSFPSIFSAISQLEKEFGLPLSADFFLSLLDELCRKPVIAERTRDMAVMRSMVGNDFGYSIANVRPLSDTSPDGNPVRIVPIAGKVRALRMGFLTAQDVGRSSAVRAIVDYGRDLMGGGWLDRIRGQPPV